MMIIIIELIEVHSTFFQYWSHCVAAAIGGAIFEKWSLEFVIIATTQNIESKKVEEGARKMSKSSKLSSHPLTKSVV